MKKFLCVLCSVFLFTGCSSDAVKNVSVTESTELQTEEVTTEVIAELATEEKVSDVNIYEKQTYREVLEDIYYNYKFPQYDESLKNYDYDMSNNEFAVYDVDNDGRDELIFMFTESCTAGMLGLIYDHNSSENLVLQFSGYPMMDFYANGSVKVYSAHNQTHSKFHPFTMYSYDKETDLYNEYGIVYALDKDIVDMVNQEKEEAGMTDFWNYPEEYDTSNSGTVYYIRPDWDKGAEIPLDVTEFNERCEQFTEGSEVLNIPFLKLTEENIKTVSQ